MLRGTAPPTTKLACFVLYLKIINTFGKIIIYTSCSKLSYWSKQHFDCLIHNFKIAWPTKISMSFLSSLDNLL